MTTKEMKELVIYGDPEWTAIRRTVEIPKAGPNEVLIKVVVAGMNPKDWKYIQYAEDFEAMNIGDDVAGFIEAVGSNVFEFKIGDRVAGFHKLAAPHGAYAQYAIVPASTTFLLPPNVSFEAGATLPLACMTAAISLYQSLRLPTPVDSGSRDTGILIWGAATAVGAYATQLAKLSGLSPIIAVAGQGIDFVKSLDAATHIIDYRTGDKEFIIAQIKEALAGKPLLHAFDTVGQKDSWDMAGRSLSPGGQLDMIDWAHVLDWKRGGAGSNAWIVPQDVTLSFTLVSSAHGENHMWIEAEEGRAAKDEDFAHSFYRFISRLLADGRLKPHPFEILPGGLDGVLRGIKELQAGNVSAKKLVARIVDTPGLELL